MRSNGAIIMCLFAALWGVMALKPSGQALWVQLIPFAVSFALILMALASRRSEVSPTPEERRRINRTVMIWSAVEGVAIFLGVNVLVNTGHGEFTMALIAVLVGAHFFPLAMGLRAPLYWATGLCLIGVAAISVYLVPFGTAQNTLIGLGCATVLWASAFIVTVRTPKPKKIETA